MVPVRGSRFAVRGSGSPFAARGALAAILAVAAPAVALACPVCGFAGNSDNAGAYVVMTVVMSGLPLAMIGGVFFWFKRRAGRRGDTEKLEVKS